MKMISIAPPEHFEILCDGYVPLQVRSESYLKREEKIEFPPTKYWYIRDSEQSIVEIGIHPDSGMIEKIVVIGLSCVCLTNAVPWDIGDVIASGIPCLPLPLWGERDRIDQEQGVYAWQTGPDVTVLFGVQEPSTPNVIKCDRMLFFVDENEHIKGFQVKGLTEEDVDNFLYTIRPRAVS